MPNFIDVHDYEWYYQDVLEATNVKLEDGSYLIVGVPYDTFLTGKGYVYEEHVAGNAQLEYTLTTPPATYTPSVDVPLYCLIDNVQVGYQKAEVVNGATVVTLYTPAAKDSTVSFLSWGEAFMDAYGTPDDTNTYPRGRGSVQRDTAYPVFTLQIDNYLFNAFGRKMPEVLQVGATPLRRLAPQPAEWGNAPYLAKGEELAQKYIGYQSDCYIVSPAGDVFVPYIYHKHTCSMKACFGHNPNPTYLPFTFVPVSPKGNVKFLNRMFPYAYLERREAVAWIYRLLKSFYARFTDKNAPSYKGDTTIYNPEREFPCTAGLTDFWLDFKLHDKSELTIEIKEHGTSSYMDISNIDYQLREGCHVLFLDADGAPTYEVHEGDRVKFSFDRRQGYRFLDVGHDSIMHIVSGPNSGTDVNVDGTIPSSTSTPVGDAWWAESVLAMEADEVDDNSVYLLDGIALKDAGSGSTYKYDVDEVALGVSLLRTLNDNRTETNSGGDLVFAPLVHMRRDEAVRLLNNFIKFCIERFKY